MNAEVAAHLVEAFATPTALMDGAEAVGDPLGTLPVLYHLLWKQWLVADLAVVLSHRTVVRCADRLVDPDYLADVAEQVAAEGGRR